MKIKSLLKKKSVLILVTLALGFYASQIGNAIYTLNNYPKETYSSVDEVLWTGPTELPDIYLIIMDEYPGLSSMEANFGYDNSDFVTSLEELGFYVSGDTYGSYPRTAMVLTSVLNMQYIDPNLDSSEIKDVWYQNSSVGRHMQELGYTYVHIGSGWFGTSENYYADINFIKKPTFLEALTHHKVDWERNLPFQIETVEDLARVPQSTFVVMHSLGCHLPQMFSNPGDTGLDPAILQARYMNTLMLDTLKTILTRSSVPPIIILMSDTGQFIDSPDLSDEQIIARLNTIEAFYLPGLTEEQKSSFGTPVNIFSNLFNYYFDGNYSTLPEKYYYVDGWEDLKHLHLVEVTDLILGR